jgi:hypothetical protein
MKTAAEKVNAGEWAGFINTDEYGPAEFRFERFVVQ